MHTARIAIIGGGLSGLYAAHLLEKHGITNYVLLEARDDFGGRIMSVPHATGDEASTADQRHASDRYDLGATWYWPELQPALHAFVNELGLDSLVKALRHEGPHIEMAVQGPLGRSFHCRAEHVLLAVPPRLAATTVAFLPALPDALSKQWASCPTWMAPHAKYLATFDRPFWREQGLSGEARSTVGPLVEIHDASSQGGAALFGFFGLPAPWRQQHTAPALKALCRAQMVRLFGEDAASPRSEFIKDWALEAHTATAADQHPAHP